MDQMNRTVSPPNLQLQLILIETRLYHLQYVQLENSTVEITSALTLYIIVMEYLMIVLEMLTPLAVVSISYIYCDLTQTCDLLHYTSLIYH